MDHLGEWVKGTGVVSYIPSPSETLFKDLDIIGRDWELIASIFVTYCSVLHVVQWQSGLFSHVVCACRWGDILNADMLTKQVVRVWFCYIHTYIHTCVCLSMYIFESTWITALIINFPLYFCMTSECRSINPYCNDMRYLFIYLWRADRALDTIWTATEETHVQKHFQVRLEVLPSGITEMLLPQWFPPVGSATLDFQEPED